MTERLRFLLLRSRRDIYMSSIRPISLVPFNFLISLGTIALLAGVLPTPLSPPLSAPLAALVSCSLLDAVSRFVSLFKMIQYFTLLPLISLFSPDHFPFSRLLASRAPLSSRLHFRR